MHAPTIILLLGLAALSGAANLSDQDGTWEFFKETHGKTYSSELVEQFRRSLFEKTVEDVKAHNKRYASGLETYSMAVNEFSDMMLSEFVGEGLPELENMNFAPTEKLGEPVNIDWRTHPGVVSHVKNQKSCGSCWAFSAAGSLEGQLMLQKNVTATLSEQQLIDCSSRYNTCHGGFEFLAYEYIKKSGIESEANYPYTDRKEKCSYDESKVITKVGGYKKLPKNDEAILQSAIGHVGPIACHIYVNYNFRSYNKGVFNDPTCHASDPNHAVLAVGFGHDDESDLDFYIVKNSWGPNWGDQGYMKIAANQGDMCEIAQGPIYPVF